VAVLVLVLQREGGWNRVRVVWQLFHQLINSYEMETDTTIQFEMKSNERYNERIL